MRGVLILLCFFISTYLSYSQIVVDGKCLNLGLKNNRFGYVSLEHKRFQIGLQHSIFSESLKNQSLQINFGYKVKFNDRIELLPKIYYQSIYNSSYYIIGGNGELKLDIFKWLYLKVEADSHYDSLLKVITSFGLKTNFIISKEVVLVLGYDDIPEYRLSEERFKMGFIFSSGKLRVFPELSIPVKDSQHKIRILCSFNYCIDL